MTPDDATPPGAPENTPPESAQPNPAARPAGAIYPAGKAPAEPTRREETRNAAETVAAAAAAFIAQPATWNAIHAAALLGEHPDDSNAASVMLELVGTGDAGTRAAALLDALDAAVQAWRLLANSK